MRSFRLDLTDEEFEQVQSLVRGSGLKDQRQLFNTALTLFQWALKQVHEGRKIGAMDESEETSRFIELDFDPLQLPEA